MIGLGMSCVIAHLFSLVWNNLPDDEKNFVYSGNVKWYKSPIMIHDVYSKGNLANIVKTILIDILENRGVVEKILIGARVLLALLMSSEQ